MRAARWLWCMAIVGWSLVPSASAQQAVRWQVDLESGKRLASRMNRMVLIHFWAEWCQACKQMEQEVFSRPEVATALQSGFVPVRLNADYFPHTRRQYGVTVLPSDVIITPDGQVVEKIVGLTDPQQYLARLNQIAAVTRNRALARYDQWGLGAPVATQQPAGPPPQTSKHPRPDYQQNASPVSENARYAGEFDRQQLAATVPPSPRYAGPARPKPGRVPDHAPGIKIPPAADLARRPNPSVPPLAQATSQNPATTTPSGGIGFWGSSSQGDNPSPQGQRGQSVPIALRLPPGNPPLGLDGYCPVELNDNQRWVLGDLRWGLIHRGRTYLFAGPQQRDRFDADPDRYAPILSGNDVVLAVERDEMVPGRREHGAWFEDRVYLFSSEATFQRFDADPYRYVSALQQLSQNVARRPPYGVPDSEKAVPGSVPGAPYRRWR